MVDFGTITKALGLAVKDICKRGLRAGIVNRVATNMMCTTTVPRPRAFSLWSPVDKPDGQENGEEIEGPVGDYTTWAMLTDRQYSARHLPPAPVADIEALKKRAVDTPFDDSDPDNVVIGEVTALFARGPAMTEGRSSLLFMFFAQWFTDSILRIDPADRRKNTSNHNIDLCQIYGRSEVSARALRSKSKLKSEKGKLAYQRNENGEIYPDYLGETDARGNWKVKKAYKALPYTKDGVLQAVFKGWLDDPKRRDKLYATGLERGNSSIGYVAISTLFLREHNAICDALNKAHPEWDDERMFQTARMINTVILMKLVVVDYINHIAGSNTFEFDPMFAEQETWYRTPWIALEFDLLYRWHGMIPDTITIGGTTYGDREYRFNNALLETTGIEALINAASGQAAGKIGLGNVPGFMLGAEYRLVKMGRDFRLQPYNAYRRRFGLKPLNSFEELTDDAELRGKLEKLYGDIDQLEFVVGLFGQKSAPGRLYGDLIYAMVAYDAFTQIYTNPLLSQNVFNERTFTKLGLDRIKSTNSVQDLASRNTKQPVTASFNA
ncbi:MAG: hypothetical protein HQ483_16150 [Rhodospirillales bacterium]|nr:hypothetical protein [Rhodospirillales bacterium]